MKDNKAIEYKGFEPRQNKCLIQEERASQTTKGGLYLPGAEKEKLSQGIVLATGPRVEDLKVGQRVMYRENSGFLVTYGGEDFKMIYEDEAFARIPLEES